MRVLVIMFNFLFVLIGVAVLACSIFMYVDDTAKDVMEATGRGDYINITLYVLMGVGAVILLIGLFGCCGAYHESQCLLAIYFIFLLLVFAAQVAAGVMGFLFKNKAFETADAKLTTLVNDKKKNKKASSPVDNIQDLLKCCGAQGPADYGVAIPKSCCNPNSALNVKGLKLCDKPVVSLVTAYQTGCISSYKDFINKNFFIILIVVLSVGLIEFLGLVFAIVLCCNVRSRERAYQTVETHDGHPYS